MNSELTNRPCGEVATAEQNCGCVSYTPRVDIGEKEDELRLYADLPGVAPEDLEIRFDNGELTIEGKVAPRHGDVEYLRNEYGVGDFQRSFSISEVIDAAKISAELKNGVLTVHLPKTEAVKPRRIDVRTA